ncbi:VIT1/CCC1 transporter family protein [Microbulbifer salipaludis]|uniref:VIT1/CCC1 transporter family protein n=1 Tax=Microbulbifer salipaludis TaxID=187980 RepID=A0ABS3E3A3_9GAMM|nr:VIT1/CCC1 transporter family protein [Microbulbifer salipaludis]MBN8429737.1 VIT1/CCC1 transporter family protein [Microbulbifer salipaludis]
MNTSRRRQLQREHQPDNIARRLAMPPRPERLSDMVLGGIDGCITTFAIAAGAFGAGFSPLVVLVMGMANLLADGISMAVSNYEAVNAQQRFVENARRTEEEHIHLVPEGEREEVRQIYARKGFSGESLEQIVDKVTANRGLWIDTMLSEEYGLSRVAPNPLASAWWTFVAFIVVGVIPLLPFLVPGLAFSQQFIVSSLLAGLVFFAIGLLKGWVYRSSLLRAGLTTFLLGGCAAAVAFIVGHLVQQAFGGLG